MKPEDQLMDALLKEQAKKREADEALLVGIETALDGEPAKKVSKWRRAMPLSIAALLALTAAGVFSMGQNLFIKKAKKTDMAVHEVRPDRPLMMEEVSDPMATSSAVASDQVVPPAESRADQSAVARVPVDDFVGLESLIDESRPAEKVDGFVSPAAPPVAAEGMKREVPSSVAPAKASRRVLEMPESEDSATMLSMDAASRPSRPLTAPMNAKSARGAELAERRRKLSKDADRYGREGFMFPDEDSSSEAIFGRRSVGANRDNYGPLVDQPWKSAWDEALSTFSIDVDTASYTNLRRMIKEGRSIQPDAVRIEECINYFDYNYPGPEGDSPFRVQSVLATCPWKTDHLLARVSIKGREIGKNARPASNLVFLIDVSGSMQSRDKLPMLKRAMKLLIEELDERDRVGMVVYAGTEGVVLPPTRLDQEGKSKAIAALAKLEAGGSTNGGAGLKRAYQMALENMQAEGVNRVILASDGDFNVGTTGQGELVKLVKERADKGVSLSVLGFGTGNLNDAMMEEVTNNGNGNYFYVGSDREAKRVFVDKLSGTLVTIAKDVKIQVEFNPGKVKAYRLIGYANRVLRNQDFNNDKVDAGDIGAGHTVTAFYEIVPTGVAAPGVGNVDELRYQKPEGRKELVESPDWLTLKLRYKHPEGDKSQLIETPVRGEAVAWSEAGNDFRMASSAALFGMKLRKMEDVAEIGWDKVIEIAKPTLAEDPQEQRAEFVEMLKKMK
ncbi:vWA domain-containing protein [Haloferula sp.]|uniref:vWA domain-containing protein n=1 Tax=Haloferula sp. TaxID=2497595 RepID=UPI0032A021B3